MKFLVAAATAGALVAGSAAGAMAAPLVAKPSKKAAPTVVLKSVDLKRHSAINFANVNLATDSPIRVTARFKDSSGNGLNASSTFEVTLAEYTRKVGGRRAAMPTVSPVTADLTWTRGKKSKLFSGVVESDQLRTISEQLKAAPEGTSALLCLSSISPEHARSTKMKKRLDSNDRIAVGDCVRLVYKAPTTPPADSTAPPAVTTPGAGTPTTTSPTTSAPGAGTPTTTSPTTSAPGADPTTPPAGSTTPVTTTTPGKSAVVLVKAVDRGNTLYVNVNPNKGKGYWRFQVQRKKANGAWKSLSTYRTHGKKETRRLDLKKGTYRVVVLPKYGHLGATSAEVALKR